MALPRLNPWSLGTILNAYLPKSGGTMTGDLVLVGAPDADLKAATKKYVDDAVAFVGFSAYKGANQTGVATATNTKVTFETEEFDSGEYYDAASSKFTPPAGKYLISAAYHFSAGNVDEGYLRISLYKNGSAFKTVFSNQSGTGVVGILGSWLVDADGDDYFEVYCYGATTTSLTVSSGASVTYFQAAKVG